MRLGHSFDNRNENRPSSSKKEQKCFIRSKNIWSLIQPAGCFVLYSMLKRIFLDTLEFFFLSSVYEFIALQFSALVNDLRKREANSFLPILTFEWLSIKRSIELIHKAYPWISLWIYIHIWENMYFLIITRDSVNQYILMHACMLFILMSFFLHFSYDYW